MESLKIKNKIKPPHESLKFPTLTEFSFKESRKNRSIKTQNNSENISLDDSRESETRSKDILNHMSSLSIHLEKMSYIF